MRCPSVTGSPLSVKKHCLVGCHMIAAFLKCLTCLMLQPLHLQLHVHPFFFLMHEHLRTCRPNKTAVHCGPAISETACQSFWFRKSGCCTNFVVFMAHWLCVCAEVMVLLLCVPPLSKVSVSVTLCAWYMSMPPSHADPLTLCSRDLC